MPTTRQKPTKAEIVEHVARARQMQALDIEVAISEEWLRIAAEYDQRNTRVEIEQFGGIHESTIFELESGCVGYIVGVRITNQTSKVLDADLQLRMPWEDDLFEWLPPLKAPLKFRTKADSSYQTYRFPGKSGIEFQYETVLNHVLLEGEGLPPGRPLRGLLLATGGLMPPHLQHGQWLSGTLAIMGSDHREYQQQVQLWTERLESRPKPVTRRSSLHDDSEHSGVLNDARRPGREMPGSDLRRKFT